jgi:HD-GYP domain-containing protein (c-di-GMP phosphodiesterase class II)
MLTTADQVAQAIEGDERLRRWSVKDRRDGYLEVQHDDSILVLVWPALWRDAARLEPHLVRARSGNYALVLLGTDADFVDGAVDKLGGVVGLTLTTVPVPIERLVVALRAADDSNRLRQNTAALELDLERARYENDLLISIGRALSKQRDIGSLLEIILRRAREVTGADAGSVYVVEGQDDDVTKQTLRFTVSQNDSVVMESKGFTMPVSSSSIVGACVIAAEVIAIPDLYRLDEPGTGNNPWGFVHDRSFDDKHGYQTRSMLTVPMISARNHVIGVIQLINKRARGVVSLTRPEDFDRGVVPFDEISGNYAATLASQAGIALETALLYDEVKTLFEGFVRASVTAIESRDPTTSGHSERVADLTIGLATAADRVDRGPYADLSLSVDDIKQIEYAALLHDFGKVGVREHVLVKAKKLYEHQRDLIVQRFEFIKRTLQVEQLERKVRFLLEASREDIASGLPVIEEEARARLAELDEYLRFVLEANEPTVLEAGGCDRIAELAARMYLDGAGQPKPYLTGEEVTALQILRGSLTAEERFEIESHVVHTFNFLKQIPWGRTFREIPEIAGAHHEKLDGTGYPNRLTGDRIPVPAKMMAISDIYDALTASDRPYKRAVPETKALDILADEVKRGKLDDELFRIFVEAGVYHRVRPAH